MIHDKSGVHLPQPPKKGSDLLHFILYIFVFHRLFYRVFRRFATRGVQKHDGTPFKKIHQGSSQKMWYFFPPFFFRRFAALLRYSQYGP
jgi:hypothetical protein